MKSLLSLFIIFLTISLVALAQGETCPSEIEAILETVREECSTLGRNQLCYGNQLLEVELLDDAENFSQAGDITDVDNLVSLQTYPFSPEDEEWGVAIFQIQADIPETLPGQLVTLVVFGDVELRPDMDAAEDYPMPMQAFLFSTGIGTVACDTVPTGGILLQNPQGVAVNLMINGFELRVSSTVFLTAETSDELTISTLEGNVRVSVESIEQDIPAGFSLSLSHDTAPELPAPVPELEILPSELLPEAVPELGEPTSENIGLLNCANSGGVDVTAGSTVILRGGWAEYELAPLIAFAASSAPTLDYDGQTLVHNFRQGPIPWTGQDGEGFAIHWYWRISDVAAGTHNAIWHIGGDSHLCEIRAS